MLLTSTAHSTGMVVIGTSASMQDTLAETTISSDVLTSTPYTEADIAGTWMVEEVGIVAVPMEDHTLTAIHEWVWEMDSTAETMVEERVSAIWRDRAAPALRSHKTVNGATTARSAMLQETTTARLAHQQTRLIVRSAVVQEKPIVRLAAIRGTTIVRLAHHQPRPTALLVIVQEKVSARSEVVQVVLTAHSETIVDLSEEVAEMQEVVLSAAEDKNNNRYIKTKILYAKLLNKLES